MHSGAGVVGPCARDVEKGLRWGQVDLGEPWDGDGMGDRRGRRGGGADRCGSSEKRVDEVEREKRPALQDPF